MSDPARKAFDRLYGHLLLSGQDAAWHVFKSGWEAREQPAQEPDPEELTIAYMSGLYEGKKAERQRIVNLLMIQHEAANGAHNYWQVAANLIQADVASDT